MGVNMDIDEAIEILRLITNTPPSGANQDYVDAVNLGIEALIFTKNFFKLFPFVFPLPQPGETEQ